MPPAETSPAADMPSEHEDSRPRHRDAARVLEITAPAQSTNPTTSEEMALLGKRALEELSQLMKLVRVQVALASVFVEPYVQTYAAQLRPWPEFMLYERPDTVPELVSHVERNLEYFQANYLLIGGAVFATAIFMHPSWLMAVMTVAVAWVMYVARGGLDPNWKPKVGGVELISSYRLTVLYTGSLAVIFLVFGEALLVLLGTVAMLSAIHAAFHPAPAHSAALGVLHAVAASGAMHDMDGSSGRAPVFRGEQEDP
mmetsp:Transcript_8117/g.20285  ORF Transcript_8117/g.20285 Transcript_8117/m.20285 type:complete len:256 (-) Transcript_8117:132-899(-)